VLLLVLAAACSLFAGAASASSLLVVSDPKSATHQRIVERLAARLEGRLDQAGQPVARFVGEQQFAGLGLGEKDRVLVVTIGARAAASTAGVPPGASLLNVFLPLATHRNLQQGSAHASAAIVLDQPLSRQLAVARALLPDARRAAMLGSAQPADPLPLPPGQPNAFGFELRTSLVEEGAAPVDAIRDVLRNGDVVIMTFDPRVYTPVMAKWLLYLASQKQTPIIGFSHALLEAGALASVYSTPEQIADQTIEAIEDWLENGRAPRGIAYPRYYHLGINGRVARQLGVEVPGEPELERHVDNLLEESR
jgi:hypothetical protein